MSKARKRRHLAEESLESEPREATDGPVSTSATDTHQIRAWATRHRVELVLFATTFFLLACFSGPRFWRQSAAPHFIYQAQGWLSGRIDLDPDVLPNLEDWACVREQPSRSNPGARDKQRCTGAPAASDRWYVSFPPAPVLVMLPLVALHGYQFNDTSFTVVVGALALVLAYLALRQLSADGESNRSVSEDVGLALLLGFGSLFFSCAIRGEVWFTAEVMGVAFTFLYVLSALRARRPLLAGVFYALATLTRTPLVFSAVFFLFELVVPGGEESRGTQLELVQRSPGPTLKKLALFTLGAAPLAVAAALYNVTRFGHLSEFGHAFLYNNRVNADIDRYGLFNFVYLSRNIASAFLKLPRLGGTPPRLEYDPNGLSLFLTLPWLLLLFAPRRTDRLQLPLWVTVAACALPGLLYQNNGYMQFGFRFSLDYTPYLLLLLAVSGWSFRSVPLKLATALAVLVNFWGAVAFRGYTEIVRGLL